VDEGGGDGGGEPVLPACCKKLCSLLPVLLLSMPVLTLLKLPLRICQAGVSNVWGW
jgi:hypothetical protein